LHVQSYGIVEKLDFLNKVDIAVQIILDKMKNTLPKYVKCNEKESKKHSNFLFIVGRIIEPLIIF